MEEFRNYYEVLGIGIDSSKEEIKKAFRSLSMKYHPDKSQNLEDSNAKFRLILNGYKTLSNDNSRMDYDRYLKNSSVIERQFSNTALKVKTNNSNSNLLSQINIILWEIEDYLSRNSSDHEQYRNGFSAEQYIAMILGFLDYWILEPSGFGDSFMVARKLLKYDPREYVFMFDKKKNLNGHFPYMDVRDYFYDIRIRADRFLNRIRSWNITKYNFDDGRSLMDAIMEFHDLAVHYLSYLLDNPEDKGKSIKEYRFKNECYKYSYLQG